MKTEQYMKIAYKLSLKGSDYQKKVIDYYSKKYNMESENCEFRHFEAYIKAITEFIDLTIAVDNINVDDYL